MKLTRKKVWLAAVCFIILSTTIMAEAYESKVKEDESGGKDAVKMKQDCRIDGRADTLQSTDEIMGMLVKNKQGETLGSIEELIVDGNRQTVQYVILSAQDKSYPVPWTAFDTGMETYTLDISRQTLLAAPVIASTETEQLSRLDLQTKALDYYATQIADVANKSMGQQTVDWIKDKTQQTLSKRESPELYAANRIIGFDVKDTQGGELGELDDIIFDVRQGNVVYGLIGFGGIMGFGENTAAVPWESIELLTSRKIARVDADKGALQASMLPDGDLKMLSEPTFARQIHQGFNQTPYWEVFGFIEPTAAASQTTAGTASETITGAAWRQGSVFNNRFDVNTVKTMNGTIKKVSTFSPENEASPGLRLKVLTDEGRTVNIYAGPKQHYLQQPVRFQRGDQITVTGSQAVVNQKSVIMASEISKGSQSLTLRDSQGKPSWNVEERQAPRTNP